jgi:hypothetical protein
MQQKSQKAHRETVSVREAIRMRMRTGPYVKPWCPCRAFRGLAAAGSV